MDSIFKLKMHASDIEKSNKAAEPFISFARKHATASFLPILTKLYFRHCMRKGMGCVDQNCFSESKMSALAIFMTGPKTNNKLCVACDAIINHADKRHTTDSLTCLLIKRSLCYLTVSSQTMHKNIRKR